MTPLSTKILESYQIRKTSKQKLAFIDLMKEHFPALQVQEFGIIKTRNIIVGDVENAKIILSAHYDTCSVLPFPNFITPKKPLLTVLYSFLIIIPIFLIVLFLNTMLNLLSNNYWLHYIGSLLIYFGMLAMIVIGPPNKHTANDNTSGVITLCELLQTLPAEDLEKVACIFFDHEETGLFGSFGFRRRNKEIAKTKLLINLDCVSDGDNFLMALTQSAKEAYSDALLEAFPSSDTKNVLFDDMDKIYYPSDHAGFDVAVAVAALKQKPVIGYYMDRIHTSKDTVFDESNISFLCDGICRFLNKL